MVELKSQFIPCSQVKIFRKPSIAIFLFLIFINCRAQNGSTLSGQLTGFALSGHTGLVVNQYNGISYSPYDTVSTSEDGYFDFKKKLTEGFYELRVPEQGIERPFYVNGKDDVKVTLSNSAYQIDQAQFEDAENRALSELLVASKHLEITLNTLLEQFDPRQLDSLYYTKIGPYNHNVQQAYKIFNAEVEKLKLKYPETSVMKLFSSFYQIPLFDEDKQYGHYYDNQDAYMRDHFFDLWKLNDPRVIYLPEIKLKLEKYFRYFAKRDYNFLTKACDDILGRAKQNGAVQKYMATLLINFFSDVKENDVVAYIVENSLNGCMDGIDLSLIHINNTNLRGMKISDLVLPDEDGHLVDLAGVYSSETITILYFWTPECIHCREFHPVVKRLKEKYGASLGIYRVCLEDDTEQWHNASREFSLYYNNTIASGEQRKQVNKTFNIRYTPTVFILNGSGIILDKDVTGEDLEKSISVYF